ncbi:phosphopantothenoylcysteine decarboxylase, partial [Escherichia coli]|uniref:phosphopantothenoylcysteine decarboxylase n=1 Tax=Escherichia coli TaxID=562 RepID=UPI0010CC52D7
PVRYISNHSSGKMGFAIAVAASRRGANVPLVTGPVSLPTPPVFTRVTLLTCPDIEPSLYVSVTQSKDINRGPAYCTYAHPTGAPSNNTQQTTTAVSKKKKKK